MNLGRRLWRDECGNVTALSMMLLVVIVAIGALVGLVTFRDQVVQEFGDLATAIDHLDQSFTGPLGTYTDPGPIFGDDVANMPPACLSFVEASDE